MLTTSSFDHCNASRWFRWAAENVVERGSDQRILNDRGPDFGLLRLGQKLKPGRKGETIARGYEKKPIPKVGVGEEQGRSWFVGREATAQVDS